MHGSYLNSWNSVFKIICSMRRSIVLLLTMAVASAEAHWPNTNATKWVQFPDASQRGIDVLAGLATATCGKPIVLADDFACHKTGPITDIHIWASWLNDQANWNIPITLAIWTDVPAITNVQPPIPSHPGSMLWQQTFLPSQYQVQPWKSADEMFWSPDPTCPLVGVDHLIWQYNFYPTNPFVQQGSLNQPVVYWLSMTAGAVVQPLGWKTATNHWNDDAVYGHLDAAGTPLGDWQELRDPKDPAAARSLDLSFALTTREIPNPPPPPTNKWVQYPDQFNGLDVNDTFPNILADDFLCTEAGTLTNIQIWGSWRDDAPPDTTMGFELAVWSDVPGGTTTSGNVIFSHPGTLLWSEQFPSGSYGFTLYTNGTELFYDPNTGQLTPETIIWKYNFNPKQPFCQKGSTNSPVVYWLSVRSLASTSGNLFGWKTSTNHWNDDAVYGHVNATGTALGDWKELIDPRLPTLVSMDLAFLINNGPPSPECDNQQRPKVVQWPDTTPRGIDVRANWPKVVGDDFLCRRPGPINGVTVWGSWLNDKLDTNAVFQLSLWTDVPKIPGSTNAYSHPGQLVCSEVFYPPTAVGTSLIRYKYGLSNSNLAESFMDPDIAGGFIGNDTQIWRYDFYPRQPCWRQVGTPTSPRVYWVTLTAYTTNIDVYLFGWKTSTNHWNDDGVWGHLTSTNPPTANDWKDLHDPRPPGDSLDLSFALRSFPIVGINKDLVNKVATAVTGVQIIVAGVHEVTWHYDDSPAWPTFSATYIGGNTVLTWTGKTVAPNAITHVGFEMGGTSISIVSMNWLIGNTIVGHPVQGNFHTWNNAGTLTMQNDISTAPIAVLGGTVEFYADPVPLNQMNPGVQRNPIATFPLPIQPTTVNPGCAFRVPVPTGPATAQYAMFTMNLGDDQGGVATMDFLQLPLELSLRPVISGLDPSGGNLNLRWFSIPGRSYRVQSAGSLTDSFFDIFYGDMLSDTDEVSVMVPMTGPQMFIRVLMVPE
jgi:hypothetical protein